MFVENHWTDFGNELVIVFKNGHHYVLSSDALDETGNEFYGVVFDGSYTQCRKFVENEVLCAAEESLF